MANPTHLLRRKHRIDPVEVEAARSLTLARLSTIFDDETGAAQDGMPTEATAAGQDDTPAEEAPSVEPVMTDADATVESAPSASRPSAMDAGIDAAVTTDDAANAEPVAAVDDVAAHIASVSLEVPGNAVETLAADDAIAIEAMTDVDLPQNGHDVPAGRDQPDAIMETTEFIIRESRDGEDLAAARLDRDAMTALLANGVPVMAGEGFIAMDPYGWDPPETESRKPRRAIPSKRAPRVAATATSTPTPRPRSAAARRAAAKPAASMVAVIASCPYCALLLEPPPEADRRCPRCRQRIVVKRVKGRAVYLTEASVEFFEAERRRVASSGRWTRDRERWLKLAGSVGAPAGRIARLERAILSDKVVADARVLYETTVERLVRAAKRDHRWDDAERLRRDEAFALYRIAGSPVPPPDDLVALHREGAQAALRGLGEIAKEAELSNVGCCDACRADHGQSFRISRELREPRLPHPGCPKGLCRCRWELTARHRNLIGGHLRRHARPDRVAPSA